VPVAVTALSLQLSEQIFLEIKLIAR